jgi:hypothetical protein
VPPVEEPPPAEPPVTEPERPTEPPPPDPEPKLPGPEPDPLPAFSPSQESAEADADESEAAVTAAPPIAPLEFRAEPGPDTPSVSDASEGADETADPAQASESGDAAPEAPEGTPAPSETIEGKSEAAMAIPGTTTAAEAHWLLSLFTPAPGDAIDWRRGNYSLLERGGRIESPAGAGELKKQLPMVTEGSVIYAASQPYGSAPNVAPDGFAHPVFRAGFALSIPLPEVR